MPKKNIIPVYQKYIGMESNDPEIKERLKKQKGDYKINSAKYFYCLQSLLDVFKKEINKNQKEL